MELPCHSGQMRQLINLVSLAKDEKGERCSAHDPSRLSRVTARVILRAYTRIILGAGP